VIATPLSTATNLNLSASGLTSSFIRDKTWAVSQNVELISFYIRRPEETTFGKHAASSLQDLQESQLTTVCDDFSPRKRKETQ
jgi:hypothetical protein